MGGKVRTYSLAKKRFYLKTIEGLSRGKNLFPIHKLQPLGTKHLICIHILLCVCL